MPIQTRCPSCAAAVPPTAAWCSLCHADLRPRSASPVVAPSVTVVPDPLPGSDRVESTVAGRHASTAPVATTHATGSGGRHAARAATSRTTARSGQRPAPQVSLEGIGLPTDGDVGPEQVDVIAAQMLQRLAITETRTEVLDPDGLPGGKWGFAAGVMVSLVLAFVVVSWLLVHLTNR